MNVTTLKNMLASSLILTVLLMLGGCGGGSGGGSGTAPLSTIQLTVEAANVPTGTMLGALRGIITVPVGVDMRTLATGQIQEGVITAAGTAATGSPHVIGNYNSSARQLTFDVISPTIGFGNGNCAVITFDIASGTTVTAADFTPTSAQGKDFTTAATVPGVTMNLK